MIGIQISGKQTIDRWIKIVDILQIKVCQIILDPFVFSRIKPRFHYQSLFEQLKKSHQVEKIFLHTPDHTSIKGYASSQRIRCWRTLRRQLEHCELMGVDGFVVHVGIDQKVSEKELSKELSAVFYDSWLKTPLMLENTAHPSSSYGCQLALLENLLEILEDWTPAYACLDSAHLFAAGYNFETKELAKTLKNKYPYLFNKVGMLHMNDSKEVFGSFKDRHEEPGKGFIGWGPLGAFLSLFGDDLPIVLEPPQMPFENLVALVERFKMLIKANIKK